MNLLKKITAAITAAALLCSALTVQISAKSAEIAYKVSYKNKYTLVTLTPSSENSTIYYTTDGSKPDSNSEVYENGIKLYSASTLRAAEFNKKGDKTASIKVSVKRRCSKATLAAEKVKGGFNVALFCATDGAKLYYTTDGSKPTTDSTLYEGVFTVKKGTEIRAIAVKSGWKKSTVASFTVKKAVGEMPKADFQLDEYSEEILRLVNEFRAENGLPALAIDETLCEAAEQRAKEIAKDYSIGHTRPDGRKWYTVLAEFDFVYCFAAENLAYTEGSLNSPKTVTEMWINSPTHCANILNESGSLIGIAWVKKGNKIYWVQQFGERMQAVI